VLYLLPLSRDIENFPYIQQSGMIIMGMRDE